MRRLALVSVVLVLAAGGVGGTARQSRGRAVETIGDGRAGVLVVDLASWRSVFVQHQELVSARIAPGSVLKVATLMAGLQAGTITPATRFTCRRKVTAGDRQLVCTHPDLGRPLTPAEALAHSCNDFFVTMAGRLSREALSAATSSLGLGPIAPRASLPLAAVGLAGIESTPEQLLRALVRALDPSLKIRPETREVLLQGLRGSVEYGGARALRAAGLDGLAQVATVPMAAGGAYHGLAVAVTPSGAPSRGVVVMLPGGSGEEAAAIAAQALTTTEPEGAAAPTASPPPIVRPPAQAVEIPLPAEKEGMSRAPQELPVGTMLRIGRARPGGYDVVPVPLEEYVARVVAGEAAARSAPAALEAVAIVVRTFALANRMRHAADGFDLCDQTHCQVMATATAATRQAADATAGRVLLYHGGPASVFYTASCGGQSELPEDVWPRASAQPFLRRHKESPCRDASAWRSQIAGADLLRALQNAGFTGEKLRNLKVARRTKSGRAAVLRVEGLQPESITGDDLRAAVGRTLGWQYLKSTAFNVKRSGTVYRFDGHGSGHGVGLCLIGTARMGAQGKSISDILKEYFPGTTIGTWVSQATTSSHETARR
jgi:stage II sporulation protein D